MAFSSPSSLTPARPGRPGRRPIDPSAARVLLLRLFHDHPTKPFDVRLWDGTEIRWGARQDFTLVFRDPPVFSSLMSWPDPSAFAEAYVDGRVDVEGDIDAAVGLAAYLERARARVRGRPGLDPWQLDPVRRATSWLASRLRTRRDDLRDVRAHYELPEGFFRLFLDERMVYSCAYFAHAGQPLEEAQERKLDLVCRKLQLCQGDAFLDVGCGWGALLVWAAQRYGVRAHGITLSRSQAETARARALRAGVGDRVTVELRDYRDLPRTAFDKIASVGMIEHVGVPRYAGYFAALERVLRPGGLLLNHGITKPRPGARPGADGGGGDFMLHRVFPGAEIGGLSQTLVAMEGCGFEILDVQSLRPHYALTLREWGRRFAARRAEGATMVPEATLRAWDLYLPGCRRAFESGGLAVHQCLAAKRRPSGAWPSALTREDLLLRRAGPL